MITSASTETQRPNGRPETKGALPRIVQRFASNKFAREGFIFASFIALTALMTWPWVTRLRDACADPGDPYLVSWILWWDYHQTFTAPLHLFDANIFYPLRQTLAFSENDYGISLLFFPLFALGFQPLTVNSIATFLGFAFCGYGAFRLTRTLTASNGAAWMAGLVFAFIPYRFHLLSQLHYVFTGWMPLALEALVLFARERSPRRTAWLAVAFTMNGLSCVSWFVLSLVPLALSLIFLSIRYRLLSDRKFWMRGAIAASASILVLLPFMLPYYLVSKAYGFTWGPEVVARNSSTATRWLVAESRHLLWKGFGDNFGGSGPRMFTGLLAPLLAVAALLLPALRRSSGDNSKSQSDSPAANENVHEYGSSIKWVVWLDGLAIVGAIFAVLSLGWRGSLTHPFLGRFFAGDTLYRSLFIFGAAVFLRLLVAYPAWLRRTMGETNLIAQIRNWRRGEPLWWRVIWGMANLVISITVIAVVFTLLLDWTRFSNPGTFFDRARVDQLLLVFVLAVIVRLSLTYPLLLRRATGAKNLIEHIRNPQSDDALWLGTIWLVTGFFMSLGTNSWFYRILYDLIFLFRSMREPSRAAMVADLGLAVLAGLGAMKLTAALTRGRWHLRPAMALSLIILAVLFELRAAPLRLERGAVNPDELTLRLKQTPMRGGLVELPTGTGTLPHLYMLRAADHGKPLINAISTFVPPHAWEIESLSRTTPIPTKLLDAMEKVPTSYLVIHNPLIEAERRASYESFLAMGISTGRLRFIKRYGTGDDLYALVKTEPEVKSEGALPFALSAHEWAAMIQEDQTNMLAPSATRCQTLFRLHLASTGTLPRYAEFIKEVATVARGVIMESEDQDQSFQDNLRRLAEQWVARAADPDDAQYVDRLLANGGLKLDVHERAALIDGLSSKRETRAAILMKIVGDQRFVEKENYRSLILLHYFAYLHRNPGEPPDKDLSGFDFWIQDLSRERNPAKLTIAFRNSIEYRQSKEGK